jgi:two-component system phosphate regulon sensor histidine kinase PhoR
MNPRLLFWLPAALRIVGIFILTGIISLLLGLRIGFFVGLLGMAIMVVIQLHYLFRLSRWLENPEASALPDGWGAWTNVFARLYRLRRDDEKNRKELDEWLTRFRQAMDRLPDGVVIMDDVLFLEWCNPLAESHLGLDGERDKGMRVTNLVRHPDFVDYIILGRYEQPLPLSFRDRKLLIHIIPFENRRQILVTQDITEAERIEMMRHDFIANASHELRTPLTVINGFLEIACAQPDLDTETRVSHLKLMAEQGRRMQRLVDDMLSLTRLESIDYPLRPENCDMRQLLDQVWREGEALSGSRHTIALTMNGPDIKGNPEELRSAFSNLVSNAVRYTPEGGRIDLFWRQTDEGPQFVVKDTGIGIRQEHIARLTERFYRVDKSRSRETQGTGLGLAIVKHVLLRHKGTLLIESEPNKGSTFAARFPRSIIVESLGADR